MQKIAGEERLQAIVNLGLQRLHGSIWGEKKKKPRESLGFS